MKTVIQFNIKESDIRVLEDIATVTIHMRGPNDPNGNPRRLFMALPKKMGDVVAIFEEGYGGYPEALKGAGKTQGPDISISATEYNKWKRFGRQNGLYYP